MFNDCFPIPIIYVIKNDLKKKLPSNIRWILKVKAIQKEHETTWKNALQIYKSNKIGDGGC